MPRNRLLLSNTDACGLHRHQGTCVCASNILRFSPSFLDITAHFFPPSTFLLTTFLPPCSLLFRRKSARIEQFP